MSLKTNCTAGEVKISIPKDRIKRVKRDIKRAKIW